MYFGASSRQNMFWGTVGKWLEMQRNVMKREYCNCITDQTGHRQLDRFDHCHRHDKTSLPSKWRSTTVIWLPYTCLWILMWSSVPQDHESDKFSIPFSLRVIPVNEKFVPCDDETSQLEAALVLIPDRRYRQDSARARTYLKVLQCLVAASGSTSLHTTLSTPIYIKLGCQGKSTLPDQEI